MKLNITINDAQLQAYILKFPASVDNGVAHVAHAYEADVIKAMVGRGWKDLPSSVAVQKRGFAAYMVHATARSEDGKPYGTFQEFGTGNRAESWNGTPTPRGKIKPVRAKFMHFTWNGQEQFRRSVEGVPATHVWRDSLESLRTRMGRIFAHGVQQRI